MTSVLKKWAQIDPRIKYFNVLADISGFVLNSAFVSDNSDIVYTDVETSAFAYSTAIRIPAFGLLKDLGRTIYVVDSTTTTGGYPRTAVYRQIQRVSGLGSEGVSGVPSNGYKSYWIKVWTADGVGVARVARTG